MSTSYTVRNYRSGDREGFLDLFARVFGGAPDAEWFAWKYERNPYTDEVPIVVAETDGRIVGARSFFALDVETGSRCVTALQPCDTMVDADHRRRGLFTRMTEAAIDRYRDTDIPFFFNYPNPNSLPGNLKLGWRVVGDSPTAYRIQRPGSFLPERVPSVIDQSAATVANWGATGYHRLRRRLVSVGGDAADVTVSRRDGVPATELADIDRPNSDGAFTVARRRTFYEWRFGNPNWTYETYLARQDGETVGGVVVGTRRTAHGTSVQLTDVVPAAGLDPAVLTTVVEQILTDKQDASTVICATDSLPRAVRSAFGFVSKDTFPLSRVSRPATLAARPIGSAGSGSDDLCEADWTVDGARLDDPTNWTLSLSDRDWC